MTVSSCSNHKQDTCRGTCFQEICNALLIYTQLGNCTHMQVQTLRAEHVRSHAMHQYTADYAMAYSIDEIH